MRGRIFISFIISLIFFITIDSQAQVNIYDKFDDVFLPGWSAEKLKIKYSLSESSDSNGYIIIYTDEVLKKNSQIGSITKVKPFTFSDSCIINLMVQGISNDVTFTVGILYDIDKNNMYNEDEDILVLSKPISLNFKGWKQIKIKLTEENFRLISNYNDNFSVVQSESFGMRFDFQTGKEFKESKIETGIALITEIINRGIVYDKNKKNKEEESYFNAKNYPNPFNSSTTIMYTLNESTNVRITVYDRLGREIATLVDEVQSAGTHTVIFNASDLPSGTYFYRIKTNSYTEVKKMVLEK